MSLHPETAAALGNLLHKLAGSEKKRANGKTIRDEVLSIVKEVEPGYRLPADVALKDVENRLRAEREAEKKADQEQRAANRRAGERRKMVDELGEETVKAIEEKYIKKYPTLEYADAAALARGEEGISYQSTPPQERFRQGQIWEFPDLPNLLKNPTKAAQDAAYSVIDEMRAGRRP